MTRQAYNIRFRCILNGCDWTARVFLRDANDAFDAMYRRMGYGCKKYSRAAYRVVSCELSADQSRPVA